MVVVAVNYLGERYVTDFKSIFSIIEIGRLEKTCNNYMAIYM